MVDDARTRPHLVPCRAGSSALRKRPGPSRRRPLPQGTGSEPPTMPRLHFGPQRLPSDIILHTHVRRFQSAHWTRNLFSSVREESSPRLLSPPTFPPPPARGRTAVDAITQQCLLRESFAWAAPGLEVVVLLGGKSRQKISQDKKSDFPGGG